MSMRSGSYRLRSPTVEVERRTTETAEGETLWGSRGLLGGAGTLHCNQMLFQLPDETEQPEARWLTEQNALQRRVFDLLQRRPRDDLAGSATSPRLPAKTGTATA